MWYVCSYFDVGMWISFSFHYVQLILFFKCAYCVFTLVTLFEHALCIHLCFFVTFSCYCNGCYKHIVVFYYLSINYYKFISGNYQSNNFFFSFISFSSSINQTQTHHSQTYHHHLYLMQLNSVCMLDFFLIIMFYFWSCTLKLKPPGLL